MKKAYITPEILVVTVAPQLMQIASDGEKVYTDETVSGDYQMGRRGSWDDNWDDDVDEE